MKNSAKAPLPSKQYTRDRQWMVRHYRELSIQYPNKWVAIHKGKVAAVGDDLGSVEQSARERTGALEIPVMLIDDGSVIF